MDQRFQQAFLVAELLAGSGDELADGIDTGRALAMDALDFTHGLDGLRESRGVDETHALAAAEDDAVGLAAGGFAGRG